MVVIVLMVMIVMMMFVVVVIVRLMGHAGSMDGSAPLFNRPLPIDLRRAHRSNAAHESIVPV
jgi:flagellar basal body-associated protein FliL